MSRDISGNAGRVRAYLDLARPFTLLPPLLGIISGAVCAFGSAHNPDPAARLTLNVILMVTLGSVCASLMNAASNAVNQVLRALRLERQ
jgi:4-hydroxybenzoate polyprenyltransferase